MDHTRTLNEPEELDLTSPTQQRLLSTLEQLLSLEATNVETALNQASTLVSDTLDADKIDVSLFDPTINTLVAIGTNDSPLARRQVEIGMDRLPISNGGRIVEVFLTGEPYLTGRADQDPVVLPGFTEGLGIHSMLAVPLDVEGERRGVLHAASAQPDHFAQEDVPFLQAVAHWIGAVTHRAELVERMRQDAAEQVRHVVADELITVLAHDLRNHLVPLRGRLDLVHRRAQREGRSKDIGDMQLALRALDRLQALIRDLMDVGRLEQGIFTLTRQPMDLYAIVQEIVEVMQSRETALDLRGPEEMTIEADPDRIRQAVENLVANAIKHSPTGVPVEIQLSMETRRDGEWAVVSIRDRGPGIPKRMLPQLFQRFGRGPNSTGLGLGLYLVRSIAEAHGGTIEVETSEGQGSTFRLLLPI